MSSDSEFIEKVPSDDEVFSEDSDASGDEQVDFSDNEIAAQEEGEGALPQIERVKRKAPLSEETKLKRQKKFQEFKLKRKIMSQGQNIVYDPQWSNLEKAAYLWSYILESEGNTMTEIEKADCITEDHLQKPNEECTDANIPANIRTSFDGFGKIIKRHKGMPEHNGSPFVLILSMSAIRCTEVLKTISKIGLYIPKLFGKHISKDEQEKSLSKKVALAVGTPGRVLQLCDKNVLSMEDIKVLIIDMKPNNKTMNILSLPETRKDFISFYMKHVHKRVIDEKTKIMFL
ncbi:hypothetical protein WA158_003869 [Blastocystis sp. Blastoise]